MTLTTLPRDEALRCVMRFAPWVYAAHVELGRLLALHRTVFCVLFADTSMNKIKQLIEPLYSGIVAQRIRV